MDSSFFCYVQSEMGQSVVKLPPGLESEKEKTKWKEYPQKYSTNTHNVPEAKGYKRFK